MTLLSFGVAWYTADDFILALVPIIIIRKLQMSLGKKVAWMFLLGLGIMYVLNLLVLKACLLTTLLLQNRNFWRLENFSGPRSCSRF